MKLQLIMQEASGTPGGMVLMLADGNGTVLPGQQAVSIEQQAEAVSTITVKFVVDGHYVRVGPAKIATASDIADMLRCGAGRA
ncbi:hypothetical protein ACFOM8_01995 [Paracoccus angustae]|uniref:Uncharacterized protein n=1 Tax=Paracoccus angustae TaxID=1671480 RepID=A0ABV7TZK3_9RHOB